MTTIVGSLLVLYLWCLVGHLVCALARWGYPEDMTIWGILFWPNRLWWTITDLIHDWRTELYYRNKHR